MRDARHRDAGRGGTLDAGQGSWEARHGARGAGCGGVRDVGRGTRSRPSIYLSIKTYKSYIDT